MIFWGIRTWDILLTGLWSQNSFSLCILIKLSRNPFFKAKAESYPMIARDLVYRTIQRCEIFGTISQLNMANLILWARLCSFYRLARNCFIHRSNYSTMAICPHQHFHESGGVWHRSAQILRTESSKFLASSFSLSSSCCWPPWRQPVSRSMCQIWSFLAIVS